MQRRRKRGSEGNFTGDGTFGDRQWHGGRKLDGDGASGRMERYGA
jgi:hypothetical protein